MEPVEPNKQTFFFNGQFFRICKDTKFFFTLSTDGKCAKILSDGKCSRTSPYAPTVGLAPARSVMAD